MNEVHTTTQSQIKTPCDQPGIATPASPASRSRASNSKNDNNGNNHHCDQIRQKVSPLHNSTDVPWTIHPTTPINDSLVPEERSASCWKTPTHQTPTNNTNHVWVPLLPLPQITLSCPTSIPRARTLSPPDLVLETPTKDDSILFHPNPLFLVGPTALPSKQLLQKNISNINLWDDDDDKEEDENARTCVVVEDSSIKETQYSLENRLKQKQPRRKPTVSSCLLRPILPDTSPTSESQSATLPLDGREDNERYSNVSNTGSSKKGLPGAVPFF